MSESVVQHPGTFTAGETQTSNPGKTDANRITSSSDIPVGYRQVSRRWRVLDDGTRDYAAFHGKTEFTFLLPVSSRLRTPRR